jgi:hypothetical protein
MTVITLHALFGTVCISIEDNLPGIPAGILNCFPGSDCQSSSNECDRYKNTENNGRDFHLFSPPFKKITCIAGIHQILCHPESAIEMLAINSNLSLSGLTGQSRNY